MREATAEREYSFPWVDVSWREESSTWHVPLNGNSRGTIPDELLRQIIRACLRELEEEREALEFVTEMFGVDSITTPDSRDRVERLRSLLPETEGEA